ncbi:hypothetical protein KCU65_g6916, partial [Aureobasidium melanogenum]
MVSPAPVPGTASDPLDQSPTAPVEASGAEMMQLLPSDDHYETIGEAIAHTLNSTVWNCHKKTVEESAQSVNKSRVVVVKVLCQDRAEVERNWRKTAKELTLEGYTEEVSAYEAKTMKSLNHKHIVRFIDCHDGGTTSNMLIMNICMEKLDCDLASFIKDNSDSITKTEFA